MNAKDGNAHDAAARLEFLWKVHAYINEYIKFADAKASLILAVSSGFVAALYTAKAHHYIYPSRLTWRESSLGATLLGIGSLLAFSFLVSGFISAVLAVSPRLWEKSQKGRNLGQRILDQLTKEYTAGFIFWGSILRHHGSGAFQQELSRLSRDQLASHLAEHVFVLSDIIDRKFWYVNFSMATAFLGAIFASMVLFGSA